MQKELEEIREDRDREKELAAQRAEEDEKELQQLRERCERLETEGGGGVSRPVLYNQDHLLRFNRTTQNFWRHFAETSKAWS